MNAKEISFLIVDDDEFQRQMLRNMLVQIGANLIRDVDNGKHALDILQNKKDTSIDIIICDLNMPEMDGLEFLRHLGKNQYNVSIILLSALGSNLLISAGKIANLYEINLLGIVDKPIMPIHLVSFISKYKPLKNSLQKPKNFQPFLIEEILTGIQENQFEPFYQPKVDFNTGQIVGAETLARWLHPTKGVIPPYSFISILENNNKIDELTFLLLKKSIVAFKTFKKKYENFTLSINLSPVSLKNTSFADDINKIIKTSGIEPNKFILEITESATMTDVASALENLARLSMYGFPLSVDDYGTGFSSMQRLTRISFNELKIDQSFVRDFTENNTLRIMVKSSIDMAHNLKMKCVAEGVETLEEWNILKSMGCDIMQGFFVAKPMSFINLLEFWENHQKNKLKI